MSARTIDEARQLVEASHAESAAKNGIERGRARLRILGVMKGVAPINETEFDEVIRAERLGRWLARAEPTGATANKLCLFERAGIWYTVTTDERAGVIETTRRSHINQSDALADAVEGLRFLKDVLSPGA